MRKWNPTSHRELKVYLHSDIPGSASPGKFCAPAQCARQRGRALPREQDAKLSPDLQISKEEAKKFTPSNDGGGAMPPSVASFWMNVLSGRACFCFRRHRSAAAIRSHRSGDPPERGTQRSFARAGKIRQQFSSFLGATGIGRGAGGKPEMYWELLSADDQGVVTLGAAYNRAARAEVIRPRIHFIMRAAAITSR